MAELGRRSLWWLFIALALTVSLAKVGSLYPVDEDFVSRSLGKPPTFDFTNYWFGGRLALEGRVDVLFQVEVYRDGLRDLFAPTIKDSEWSYPPTMLLLGAPLALLPLPHAWLLWTVGSLLLLCGLLRWRGLAVGAYLLLLLSPAVLDNIYFGQNGALTAALLIGGLACARDRPVLAGLLFGLLTIKPHLGLLVPVCLLAAGLWRTVAWSALFGILLAGAATALFGVSAWQGYLTVTQPMMQGIMEADYGAGHHRNSVTMFMTARGWGLDLPTSYAIQLLSTLGCAVAVWKIWSGQASDPLVRAAATVPFVLLATPYAYSYDLVMLAAATLVLAFRGGLGWSLLLLPGWTWPAISFAVTTLLAPVSPLILSLSCLAAWRVAGPSAPEADRQEARQRAVPAFLVR